MGKYKVTYNERVQTITMDLSGHFCENDAAAFVNDFIKMSKKINTSNTYLILDCGKLFIYPCDVKAELRAVFGLYKEMGYKLVRIKLFKPQKALGAKIEELAKISGLAIEVIFVDKINSDTGEQVKI